MKQENNAGFGKKSIFRSLFVPIFVILVLQAVLFYFAAVYGGIEESLNQNAADILTERLTNRKNEIETQFNNKWADLDDCVKTLNSLYSSYEKAYGDKPLAEEKDRQISYLGSSSDTLINTLRRNEVNGIFLIINDQPSDVRIAEGETQQKYGLCIRDMDQNNSYKAREDLLIERSPSLLIDQLDCSLDSWWEARYTFTGEYAGSFFFEPVYAVWDNPKADAKDLAYVTNAYRLSVSDPAMIAYCIPLIDENGYPYGVVGVEISVTYLNSLLPNKELSAPDKCAYLLAINEGEDNVLKPITYSGSIYSRCFGSDETVELKKTNATGGFSLNAKGDVELYADTSVFNIYNVNNPFEYRKLTLVAFVEKDTLFENMKCVKTTLMMVSLFSALLGIIGLSFVSRRFAKPITALAGRVRAMKEDKDFDLERLGITEIDQLVDSIEELNRTVSKNSARTEFFSRMSHDMRTPMNAIISFSSPELTDNADEATKDDYLRKIHSSGEYLLELINEVLDMTKIESNKIDLHNIRVEACRLFSMSLPIIEKVAQEKNIIFTQDISVRREMFILADVQHVNQIVMNLLSNAVKFTPAGGRVSFAMRETKNSTQEDNIPLEITVSDSGVGMSEEFLSKLYQPFEQENSGHEGTGLGLSIAKKLIDLMNGTIECESRKNEGTVFTLKLSFEKSTETDRETISVSGSGDVGSALNGSKKSLQGKKVLVFEDNAINTEIICLLLGNAGLEVVSVPNGSEGLNVFSSSKMNEFDLILMDIRMPVMDGLEATRQIRSLNRKDASDIVIIAMTANAFAEDVSACLDAGMNAHLSKPIEPQKLFDALMHYLG